MVLIRLVRWAVAIWGVVWMFRVARHNRDLMRAQLERIDELGRRAAGYPNEWGVRTTPLTPIETAAAIENERRLGQDLTAAE